MSDGPRVSYSGGFINWIFFSGFENLITLTTGNCNLKEFRSRITVSILLRKPWDLHVKQQPT
jgi:hypothetical protein